MYQKNVSQPVPIGFKATTDIAAHRKNLCKKSVSHCRDAAACGPNNVPIYILSVLVVQLTWSIWWVAAAEWLDEGEGLLQGDAAQPLGGAPVPSAALGWLAGPTVIHIAHIIRTALVEHGSKWYQWIRWRHYL